MKAIKIAALVLILVAVVSGIVFSFFRKEKEPPFSFITVEKGVLIQEVSVSGKVKPKTEVNLSFEVSGTIDKIYVSEGEKVEKGDYLAVLERSDLKAQAREALANLEAEKAKLEEYVQGARPEEIAIAQTKVENAEVVLQDAQDDLDNTFEKAENDLNNLYYDVKGILNEAFLNADDAVNKQLNELFTDDLSDSPSLSFTVTQTQAKIDAEQGRLKAGDTLSIFKSDIAITPSDHSALDMLLEKTESHLMELSDFLTKVSTALNLSAGLAQSTLTTYKGYVTTARTNINSSLSDLRDQIQDIASQKITNQQNISTKTATLNAAQNALKLAEDELALKKAGYTKEQIQTQEAKVKLAQASLENIRALLKKAALSSPISGLVVKIESKQGEFVSAGETVLSVISEADFEIECFIPEIDIGKVKLSDSAEVVLDAYEGVEFTAFVSSINLAETLIEGVSTYKTILQFKEGDERIKPGMTANVDILTAKKENVFLVPQRAVVSKNGSSFLKKVMPDNSFVEVEVEIGLKGSDGNIEIVSGISQGDKIITFLGDYD